MISTILKVIWAAISAWNQERRLQNDPAMIKAAAAQEIQNTRDAIETAEAILADPKSSPKDHAEALRIVRLSQS